MRNHKSRDRIGGMVNEARLCKDPTIPFLAQSINKFSAFCQKFNGRLAMRLSRNDIGALVWLATCGCLLFGFFGFATIAPWTFHVMPASEAALRCPGAVDASWPAVLCNHGRPVEWELGLIRDNPLHYSLSLLQMVIGYGAFFFGARLMKRFQ